MDFGMGQNWRPNHSLVNPKNRQVFVLWYSTPGLKIWLTIWGWVNTIVTMRKFLHPAGPAIVWYYDTVHSMTRLTTHAVFSETGRPVQHDGHRNRRRLAAGYVPERDLEVGAGKDLHTVIGKQESSPKKQKMVNPQSWRFHYYPFLGTQNIAICYRRNLDIFVQSSQQKTLMLLMDSTLLDPKLRNHIPVASTVGLKWPRFHRRTARCEANLFFFP